MDGVVGVEWRAPEAGVLPVFLLEDVESMCYIIDLNTDYGPRCRSFRPVSWKPFLLTLNKTYCFWRLQELLFLISRPWVSDWHGGLR